MLEKIMFFLGVLSIGYFIGIALYAGLSSKFPFLWLAAGICFLAVGAGCRAGISLPAGLRAAVWAASGIFLAAFLVTEGLIVYAMCQRPEKGLDYLIVLGAQVKGKRPSQSLEYRIDKAYSYLKENPQTRAVLSGGQGYGEEISEAQCMYEELLQRGIADSRLLLESGSVNTMENIVFSRDLLEKEHPEGTGNLSAGIVTNGFHIFRGCAIARKNLDCTIQEVPARGNLFLQANYMVRECLGIWKDKWMGNL